MNEGESGQGKTCKFSFQYVFIVLYHWRTVLTLPQLQALRPLTYLELKQGSGSSRSHHTIDPIKERPWSTIIWNTVLMSQERQLRERLILKDISILARSSQVKSLSLPMRFPHFPYPPATSCTDGARISAWTAARFRFDFLSLKFHI